jgi:hypothetical protein
MKNTECVIYITTKRGRTWSYLKENNGWTQTGPTGIVHRLSAEQLLSHLLPPLAADNPGHLSVRVERRVEKDELSIARATRSGSVVAGSHDASGQS